MDRLYFILAMMLFGILGMASSLMAGEGPFYAVAAESESAAAQVSAQAARSPYFLLFDEQGGLVEAVANPYQQAAGGAGPQVVEFLAGKGIRTIIAGEFGSKLTAAMKGKGMTFQTATGSAADAVRTYLNH
ncbi:MAG TPA: hypothetical protein DDY20_06585 [Desulfobulbaceae bacterium]|nr:hypothetical protein [Desulfobulbaceae bacterium]